MSRKINITQINKCNICMHRETCTKKNKHAKHCMVSTSDSERTKFKKDENRFAELQKERAEDIIEFVKMFRKVRKDHIVINDDNMAYFVPLSLAQRKINSRNRYKRQIKDKCEFEKYCEQCGESFITVNDTRRICDDCWEEICNMLHFDYSQIPAYS